MPKATLFETPQQVTEDGALEILVADCLRTEPFPGEILVLGKATGWARKMRRLAENRGWEFRFTIKNAEKEKL